MSDIKQKARDEQYCAFLADIIQRYRRPRPDGSIDWNKAFVELLELRNKFIDLAIAERDRQVVEMIEKECPANSGLTAFLHKDKIINLITNSKK